MKTVANRSATSTALTSSRRSPDKPVDRIDRPHDVPREPESGEREREGTDQQRPAERRDGQRSQRMATDASVGPRPKARARTWRVATAETASIDDDRAR